MNKQEIIEQCLAVSSEKWADVLEAMDDHASVAVLGNVLCSYDFTIDREDWNRAKLRKGVWVVAKNEEHFAYIKRLMIEAGFKWIVNGGDAPFSKYIFIRKDSFIDVTDSEYVFNESDGRVVVIEPPKAEWATKRESKSEAKLEYVPSDESVEALAKASIKAYSGEQKEYSKEDFVEIGDSKTWSPKSEDLVGIADAFRKAYDGKTEYEEIGKPMRAPTPDFDLAAGMLDLAKHAIDSGNVEIAIRLLELSKEVRDER